MTKMPIELQDAILEGLSNLLALRLRGSPAADTVPATAAAWVIALSARPIAWDAERDLARIRTAFVLMMGSCETWPSPVAFMERLPPREHQNLLPPPIENTMSPATRKLVDGLLNKMRAR